MRKKTMSKGKYIKLYKSIYIMCCVYKMVEISKETWGRNGVEVTVFNVKK